jgi:hypothetical protein
MNFSYGKLDFNSIVGYYDNEEIWFQIDYSNDTIENGIVFTPKGDKLLMTDDDRNYLISLIHTLETDLDIHTSWFIQYK